MRPECDDGGGGGDDGGTTPWAEVVHTLALVGRGGRDKAAGQPDGRTEQTDRRARCYDFYESFWGPR